jgi:hypothetical protein
MSEVDNDVEAMAAVRRDRVVESRVRRDDERLQVGPFAARPQPNPWSVARRRRSDCGVDPQVDPRLVKRFLNGGRDAGLPRPWRAVENDDLPQMRFHCRWMLAGLRESNRLDNRYKRSE